MFFHLTDLESFKLVGDRHKNSVTSTFHLISMVFEKNSNGFAPLSKGKPSHGNESHEELP